MARDVKADQQGRVVIPEKSMQRAGLRAQESVTLVGERDHIEIWPTPEWEEYVARSLPNYAESMFSAAERLQSNPPRINP